MTLKTHRSEPFVVLEAIGELDLDTQDEFERVVSRLLGTSSVVVDLSGVEFLAICALRSLIICHRLAGTAGHEVFYAEPSRQLVRLLTVSGLAEVLPVRASVAQTVSTSAVTALSGVPDQPVGDLAQLDVG